MWMIARRLQRDARGAELVEVLVILGVLTLGAIAAARSLSGSLQKLAAREAAQIGALIGVETERGPDLGPGREQPPPAQGSPIGPTERGVFSTPPGFDPQHPPKDLSGTVNFADGRTYRLKLSSAPSTKLGPNGESLVELRVTRNQALGIKQSEALSQHWTLGTGAFVGRELSYGVTMREEDYRRVLAGELPFPDPGDLGTLPDGTKIVLRSEDFLNATQSLKYYKVLGINAGDMSGQGSAVSLEAHGDHVRVLAGPTDVVGNSLSLGVGGTLGPERFKIGGEVSLLGSSSLRNYELRFADLSKQSGQVAFERFMQTAEVPGPSETGVRDAGKVHKRDYDASSSFQGSLSLGPATLNAVLLQGRSVTARSSDVEYNDGHRELSGIAAEGGVSVFENVELAPDGRQTSRQTGLLLDAVDPHTGAALGAAYGQHTENKAYDVQLELNQAQYTELRNRALDDLASQGLYTSEQIAELRAGPDEHGNFETLAPSTGNSVVDSLVYHQRVDDFLTDGRLRWEGKDGVATDLVSLRGSAGAPALPGTTHFYDNDRK